MTSTPELTRVGALAPGVWKGLEAEHHATVDALLAGHLERARSGTKHPVEDFLFTYYSLRPAQLRRWHPGAGIVLLGDDTDLGDRITWREHVRTDDPGPGIVLDEAAFLARRADAVRRTLALLAATERRPAQLGCFGLHEWAMVYRLRPDGVRHAAWPLRLGPAGTDAVVESHRIRCTHHDAFRFFTPDAVPLNQLQPRREDQLALEQPGCLHAGMDLYKWAYKLLPAIPSSLVLQCFELARDIRELDMRAAPYDLSDLGYEPVRIETPEGKQQYVEAQRQFAERAGGMRAQLIAQCERLLASA